MQEGDLMVIFAQDEEEGIHKLDELGEVVPPQHIYYLQRDVTHCNQTWSLLSLKKKRYLPSSTYNRTQMIVIGYSFCD